MQDGTIPAPKCLSTAKNGEDGSQRMWTLRSVLSQEAQYDPMNLLDKTRLMNRLIQEKKSNIVPYVGFLHTLRDMTFANVFLLDANHELIDFALYETSADVVTPDENFNYRNVLLSSMRTLLRDEQAHYNVRCLTPFCARDSWDGEVDTCATILPLLREAERIGTLLLTTHGSLLSEEDHLIAEYCSALIGLEIAREAKLRSLKEGRDRVVVSNAVNSLSYSELEAVQHIFSELSGKEGLLVASRIADRAGSTRSVIVNALRKLESAGVVEARSLGMKGTHIKIINETLLPLLEKMSQNA